RDSNTFYASLRSANKTYLVRGDLPLRRFTVLHENVECPALSPNNELIAYKKRVGGTMNPWRFHVLDLATMAERELAAETRAIARLEVGADHRFGPDAGDGHLPVRVFDVGEEHVPRHLAVDAHRLHFFQDAVTRSLKHVDPTPGFACTETGTAARARGAPADGRDTRRRSARTRRPQDAVNTPPAPSPSSIPRPLRVRPGHEDRRSAALSDPRTRAGTGAARNRSAAAPAAASATRRPRIETAPRR